MSDDHLADGWECAPAPPGRDLTELADLGWIPADVPGTAAGAVRAAYGTTAALARDYDAEDWWYRVRFRATSQGPWTLELDGLATLTQGWLNGESIVDCDSMYATRRVAVGLLPEDNELLLCFRALGPRLRDGRPRARWRTRLVAAQGLRRWRTTLMGRMPSWYGLAAPVGPWRPIRLVGGGLRVAQRTVRAQLDDGRGLVRVSAVLEGSSLAALDCAVVSVAGCTAAASIHHLPRVDGGSHQATVEADVTVADARPWWPHTHGDQPLYDVTLEVAGELLALGRIGFRSVDVVRDDGGSHDGGSHDGGFDDGGFDDGGFTVFVNGERVFCRGACWVPPDPIGLASGRTALLGELERLRAAGLNMLRVTGTMTWESSDFWDCCDELGMLVWQDCMLATMDPPDDAQYLAGLGAEVRDQLSRLAGRPSLAVVSGGSETEQQPAFMGLARSDRQIPAVDELIPGIVREVLGELPYVSSSPSGGVLPTHVGTGVAHYFGVGAYLRPIEDARRARVRFAAECLAFSIPPEAGAVERWFGSSSVAGHHPDWKRAVPRDNGASWDFEDVTAHYVREIFGVDPVAMRIGDPDRALDLARATVAHLMSEVFTEWRRPGSGCGGGLVLQSRDLAPGAGWGLLDAAGDPKAPWHALRRVLAATAVLVTDEGLDGLHLHLVNDRPAPVSGVLRLELVDRRGRVSVGATCEVDVAARAGWSRSLDGLLGAFQDVNDAHHFGPGEYEAVRIRLRCSDFTAHDSTAHDSTAHDSTSHDSTSRDSSADADVVHVIRQGLTPPVADLGLTATARLGAAGDWELVLATTQLARWVTLDLPGFEPADSWFHLAPGDPRVVGLRRVGEGVPRGTVRALNALDAVPVRIVQP